MAKSKNNTYLSEKAGDKLNIVQEHYARSVDDMDQRRLRKNGWNDVLNEYHGVLPSNWPYITKIHDPVIRTTILEKTARLFNGKLRGRLVPRETGDVVKAKINNAILEYQWDKAQRGGSMIEKWALMDVQTRLYGASFAYCPWHIEYDDDGNLLYEGNEFLVLDPRDIFIDYTAKHVKDANWVQIREWKSIDEMEDKNKDLKSQGLPPMYKNLGVLRSLLSESNGGDKRERRYESQMKKIRGLEDRSGYDKAFPVLEVVTEMRDEEFIIFSPVYNVMINEGYKNPHKGVIPIVQLRYYPVPDDVYGEVEVESVLPLSRGINAILCGAIDEANITMKPPVKIAHGSGGIRMDTIVYGPDAQWLVGDSVNNVQEHQSSGAFVRNFETMYSALKAAFGTAMGDSSMGISSNDPFGDGNKTATEIKSKDQQKLSRDQYNQLYLEQALKDQMMIWLNNNKRFLLTDPEKQIKVIRIIGKDMLKDFAEYKLSDFTSDPESIQEIINFITESDVEVSDEEIKVLLKMSRVPRVPVIEGKEIFPKLEMDEQNETGTLRIEAEDLDGMYDYIPDVNSMSLGAEEERKSGTSKALDIVTNDKIKQQLMDEGYSLQAKEIIVQVLEDGGYRDGEKFLKKLDENRQQGQPVQPNGATEGNINAGFGPEGINGQQGVGPSGQAPIPNSQQQIPQPAIQGL